MRESNHTHGKSKTRLHSLWRHIKYRLKNHRSYEGIEMHAEWREDFVAFEKYINDVLGPLPAPDYSLDRIDPLKGYEPGNLRWADKTTQALNRTNSVASRHKEEWYGVAEGARYFMLTVLELTVEMRHGRNWYGARVRCDCGKEKTIYRKQLISGRTKSCGCFKNKSLAEARLVGTRVTIDGTTDSLAGWARRRQMPPAVIYNRILRGWDPERAILTPVRELVELTVDGVTDTILGWARRLGVGKYIIQRRIDKGWTAEQAVKTPVRKYKERGTRSSSTAPPS